MKKLKVIILVVILLLASIMMPFDVYADTLSTSNITYNVYLQDIVDSTNTTLFDKDYIYDVDFNFDKSYLGWVSVQMIISYTVSTGSTSQLTINRALYLNGSNVHTSFVLSSNYNGINGGPYLSMSISVNNSNVTPMADLSSLQDIIDLLQDIDDHISIDVLSELQTIVSNTSLSNQYLNTISQIRQWNIPIESLTALWYLFENKNSKITDIYNYGYWDYPIFSLNTNDIIINQYFSKNLLYDVVFVVYSVGINANDIPVVFNLDGGTSSNFIPIGYGRSYRLFKFKIKYDVEGYHTISANRDIKITPVYFGNNAYISTDFALQYGLSNQLLDDLHIIASGTTQSNSAASDLESGNEQMADDMDDLATIESGYNQQFNNQLQSIDFTSPIQNNAGILPAANFVITIFNGLINNNPFSVLIIIVCILLIGKKVIGK